MHPRVREIGEYFQAQRLALRMAIDRVPVAARERRPTPHAWSVAEVVEHLALVETAVTAMFRRTLAEARARGLGPDRDTGSVVATLDVAAVTDRTRRIEAVESGQPREGLAAGAAWARLEQVRAATVAALHDADGLALSEVSVAHGILGNLDLYQWLIFLGAHEARHTAQIRAIGESLAAVRSDTDL